MHTHTSPHTHRKKKKKLYYVCLGYNKLFNSNNYVFQCSIRLPKDADGVENIVDPDQTAPSGSSLIRVCNVCSDPSVPILRIFMVVSVMDFQECY